MWLWTLAKRRCQGFLQTGLHVAATAGDVVAAVAVALRWHMMVEDLQVNILEFADEMMKVVH